jgi:hypothetical protein
VVIALLSDIHAKLEALDACLSLAHARRVDRYAFLGDFVGYVQRVAHRGKEAAREQRRRRSPASMKFAKSTVRWRRFCTACRTSSGTSAFHLAEPDFALLRAMVHYIDAFAERFHHPKKDQYLFQRLRMRDPAAAALLDRLHEDHRIGADRIRRLKQALARYEEQRGRGVRRDRWGLRGLSLDHMRREETEVLPTPSNS